MNVKELANPEAACTFPMFWKNTLPLTVPASGAVICQALISPGPSRVWAAVAATRNQQQQGIRRITRAEAEAVVTRPQLDCQLTRGLVEGHRLKKVVGARQLQHPVRGTRCQDRLIGTGGPIIDDQVVGEIDIGGIDQGSVIVRTQLSRSEPSGWVLSLKPTFWAVAPAATST